MKTKILSILALAVMALGFGSCSESWEPKTEKTGQLALSSLGVEVAGGEELIDSSVNPVSRAEVDLKPFVVKVYKENGDLFTQWIYGDMPEIFTLPVGKYTLKVSSHEAQKAEWEHPLFEGSKDFVIENSKITNIGTIKCVFASLKVSIRFADDLRQVMGSDVKVTVVANDEGELVYTPNETRSGYFEVIEGSTTLAATFTGTVKNVTENIHKVYTDIKAGQHRIITFSLKINPQVPDPSTGYIDPTDGIYVDTSVEDEDVNGNVPVEEDPENPERPGQEDFNDGIKVTSAMSFDATLNPAEVTDATVTLTAQKGIASLSLSLPNLPDLSNIDLATAASAPYGLPFGASVKDQTSLTLDLAQVVNAIKDVEGKHTLTLAVADNAGIHVSKTLNFEVKAQGSDDAVVFEISENGIKDNTPTPVNTPGLDGKLTITVPAGISNMVLEIESTSSDFSSIISDLNLSGVDLAHPGAMEESFSGLGISCGAQVLNQTSVEFNITGFFELLAMYSGSHTFKITVTDNNGNAKAYTLILTV